MHDAPFGIPSRHGHATFGDEARALLHRRIEAVSACLNALPTDLPWKFLAEFAPMLQPPTLRELSAPPGEVPLLNEFLAGIARGLDPTHPAAFAKYLAAAMFCFLPHELPLTPAPSQLPRWIRVPYLKWSLALPQCFHEPGEADRYARWLEKWLKVLAVEFAGGRGLQDLPEYQHPHMRRLAAQQLDLLPAHFQADRLIRVAEAREDDVSVT
jgi:hypothetical protein